MESVSIKDFVKDRDFANAGNADAEPMPQGETMIDLNVVKVEEKNVTFTDDHGNPKPAKRFILYVGDKGLWAPPSVLADMKLAAEAGFDLVKVIRTGEGLKTKYKVMPVNIVKSKEKKE